MQDKQPRNDKGQSHGLWELYHDNGQLGYKCNYIKGEPIGYFQLYCSDGLIQETKFYAR